MTDYYIKALPSNSNKINNKLTLINFLIRFKKLIPTIMITIGASLLISVGYPIISYELTIALKSKKQKILSPIPQNIINKNDQILNPIIAKQSTKEISSNAIVDYNKINNWFNFQYSQDNNKISQITDYTLSIPKLRISDALVSIGGNNLNQSLIHYGGTALPGEAGNAVIFGHSILPQFYNPSSYRSMFSLIPTLKKGDSIFVQFDGIKFKYTVYNYYEVSPDEINILEQQYSKRELTLVTCVPPGTYWRRGVIKARLSSF